MSLKIHDFYKAIDEFAPFGSAEEWDNVGLLVGSPETEVKAVLVALDATGAVLDEAVRIGANLIITHHPVIFPSVKKISGDSVLYSLIEKNLSVISAHTNLDMSSSGVNTALCACLGLRDIRPLQSAAHPGLGLLGELERPMEAEELAALTKDRLNAGGIDSAGVKFTKGKAVTTVAVCGGSGSELFDDAIRQGAQALVTSEVKHHLFIAASEAGFTLVDAGHYATEAVAMPALAAMLRSRLPDVPVAVSISQTNPAFYL